MRSGKKKQRKSYISIILVIIALCCFAFISVKVLEMMNDDDEKLDPKKFYSNLKEEDIMHYEYSKINKELNGLCAFAICNGNIVGLNEKGETIDIYEANEDYTYDYIYDSKSLYLLEKETGRIKIIPLKTEKDEEYQVEKMIRLGRKVDQILIVKNDLYFLSENVLYKCDKNDTEDLEDIEEYTEIDDEPYVDYYEENYDYEDYSYEPKEIEIQDEKKECEVILENVQGESFVIKQDYIYALTNGKLRKIALEERNETEIASNVTRINYFDYYERDRLVYETTLDGQNYFKNLYYYYNGTNTNSIKNNEYFVPYGAKEYIYLNNSKKNLMKIDTNGNNKILYTSDSEIENIILIKDGHVILKNEDSLIKVNISSKIAEEISTEEICNIKYIK